MCDMLYIAADHELPLCARGPVTVASIDTATDSKLRPSFSKPHRRFVTADGTCSCDFPSFPEPMEYFDGIFQGESAQERSQSVECVRNLLKLLTEALRSSKTVEAYFAYADHEAVSPRGRVSLRVQDIVPERFFFSTGYFYEFRA